MMVGTGYARRRPKCARGHGWPRFGTGTSEFGEANRGAMTTTAAAAAAVSGVVDPLAKETATQVGVESARPNINTTKCVNRIGPDFMEGYA